jgi:hypothetical protein
VSEPVKVRKEIWRTGPLWKADCDDCGWHTRSCSPESVVREWARLHRHTCPVRAWAQKRRGLDEVLDAQAEVASVLGDDDAIEDWSALGDPEDWEAQS